MPLPGYDNVAALIWAEFSSASGQSEHAVASSEGWAGVGYRARAASEHRKAFRPLFELEPASTMQKRYLQDKHFFGFVSNAAAAAENLVYSVYVLALGINGEVLTDKSLKASRSVMLTKIRAVNRLHGLGDSLQGSFDGSIPLFEMRDTLLHRGRPPRNHFVGGPFHGKMTVAANPKASPTEWANTEVFDGLSCDAPAQWLAKLVRESITHLERVLEP